MLPVSHRLRRETDIKRLFDKGKGVFDDLCGIKFLKNGLQETRFAVIAGTKVSKSAVKRNRVKRQVRAVVEKHLAQVVPGFDVALLVRSPALKSEYAEIEKHLLRGLAKAGIVKL